MSLLEENQSTDLEKMVGLSRRGFIGAGALCVITALIVLPIGRKKLIPQPAA